ncbi:MAG TPA: YdcF family protein [Caulobacteraceae bacterium]|nr:YdcF family protein [Caulobacteraceae bacterium]
MRSAAAIALVIALWLVGLWAFATRVAALDPPTDPPTADGVVALTGANDERISVAMKLLADGHAQRLLVSGVNRAATAADIRGVGRAAGHEFDCCVDLGFSAKSTVGNARETADWAHAKGFKSLIVVTSDWHIPRAMLELHEALPEAVLTPYPVKTPGLDGWWRSGEGARRMTVEYCKYLVILAREGFLSLGPRAPAAPAQRSGA